VGAGLQGSSILLRFTRQKKKKVFIGAYSNLDEAFHAQKKLDEKGISGFVNNRNQRAND